MGRFVNGLYSRGQPIAAMIGMLIDAHAKVVPPLVQAMESAGSVAAIRAGVATNRKCRLRQAIETLFPLDARTEGYWSCNGNPDVP